MTTVVALLRSINVGGRNRLPMADLRDLVASLGFGDVQTYLQSGNVVFTATDPAAGVGAALEDGIRARMGLEVPVIVRTAPQLARLVAANPYAGIGADPKTVHVTFLARAPDAAHRAELARLAAESGPAGAFGDDRFTPAGPDVYLYCPGGYGETKLTNTFMERRAGRVATTRNWRTVVTLAGMAGIEVPGE